jgi:hypothetical protein
MLRTMDRRRPFRPNALDNRSLRLESLEPRWLCAASINLALDHPGLAAYVKNHAADGSFSRKDMLGALAIIQTEKDGVIDASDLSDLRTIVQNASALKMPDYVYVLTNDVVNGNVANTYYQGDTLGNLEVGSSNAQFSKLIGKWFYGTDLPYCWGLPYATVSGSLYGNFRMLFGASPSHLDEKQGQLGDCYLIAALGSIADSSPMAIKNMFIDNGGGSWTVRFFSNGVADYVTVNRSLPAWDGALVFAGYGLSCSNAANVLWMPLLEKAYAQWNETGKTEQGTYTNSYTDIEGGWTGNVYRQALGYSTIYEMNTAQKNAKATLINALAAHQAVTISTNTSTNFKNTGLHANHAYNVLSYNSGTGKFTLYNPWGSSQPKQLTWSQLSANASWFAATSATSTSPAALAKSYLRSASYVVLCHTPPTSTATTLDMPTEAPRVDTASSARAVDAAIVDWTPHSAHGVQPVDTTLRSSRSFWSDAAAGIAARSSGNVFADVDALFDSLELELAAAL